MQNESGTAHPAGEGAVPCDDVFRVVFDRIQTGIFIIDARTHKIADANPLAEALIGLPRDRMIGKVCHDFICPARAGQCPVTDLHRSVAGTEHELINANGEKIPVLKTVATATIGGKVYLIESFVDIIDRKKAEDRKVALIAYMNEAVNRVQRPISLTAQNLESIAKSSESGDSDPEEIRMQIRIQAENLGRMAETLRDLLTRAAQERDEIPQEFRDYFTGK